ncbi:hypothetical protein Micbo1qcDRAFT_40058 [Microdochium bolleyi]|uniref:Uncharacterized protein n=1 Tax=Microdochium bolleyi TaxID=196109 RepID=A0A136J9S7_9PEZI|nr:hypothetical protein Micbo1qcDRAFT_40058 [Microdochium bolleyi]
MRHRGQFHYSDHHHHHYRGRRQQTGGFSLDINSSPKRLMALFVWSFFLPVTLQKDNHMNGYPPLRVCSRSLEQATGQTLFTLYAISVYTK